MYYIYFLKLYQLSNLFIFPFHASMKINSFSQQNSFNGIPIIKTTLQKQVCKSCFRPIDAFVSFMEKSDLEKKGMNAGTWFSTKYGNSILCNAEEFFSKPFKKTSQNFLFVESPQEMDYCSVKALASYFVDTNQIRLSELQSLRPHESLEPVKGAGLMILYTASKIAEKLKKAQVYLISRGKQDTIDFYRHSGMIEKENNVFILPANIFKSFQEKIEERFPILKIFENNIR